MRYILSIFKSRIYFLAVSIALFFILAIFKLISYSTLSPKNNSYLPKEQYYPFGTVFDRTGLTLSASIPFYMIYLEKGFTSNFELDPLLNKEKIISDIKNILPDVNSKTIIEHIDQHSQFSVLYWGATPGQTQNIHNLGYPGVGHDEIYLRARPDKTNFASILGENSQQDLPISGLDKYLMDKEHGNFHLTISASKQIASVNFLKNLETTNNINLLEAVLFDPSTGEILALVLNNPNLALNFIDQDLEIVDHEIKYDSVHFRNLIFNFARTRTDQIIKSQSQDPSLEAQTLSDKEIISAYCQIPRLFRLELSERISSFMYKNDLIEICEGKNIENNGTVEILPAPLDLTKIAQAVSTFCFGELQPTKLILDKALVEPKRNYVTKTPYCDRQFNSIVKDQYFSMSYQQFPTTKTNRWVHSYTIRSNNKHLLLVATFDNAKDRTFINKEFALNYLLGLIQE